jgi:hypothetical protein
VAWLGPRNYPLQHVESQPGEQCRLVGVAQRPGVEGGKPGAFWQRLNRAHEIVKATVSVDRGLSMTAKSRGDRPGRLSRNVLSASSLNVEEDAAWDLMEAVRELFPQVYAELEGIVFVPNDSDEPDEDPEKIVQDAREWTKRHRLACPAVDDVATQIARGQEPVSPYAGVWYFDEKGQRLDLPAISANPSIQTLEEFLKQAKHHYREMRRLFLKRGYKKRVIKREAEHFRYLAAHLVGRYSWADMARNQTPFAFSLKSEKTIAGEARKAARLVGISLPTKRGPRLGSRRRPRHRRA